MIIVHTGFDTIDLAIKTSTPLELVAFLEERKAAAQELQYEIWDKYAGLTIQTGESGKRGGYAYTFKIDGFGAVWFSKKPKSHDPWGLFVSIGSRELALNGLGRTRETLAAHCETLGFRVPPDGISINRVDFAIDILAPDFILDPDAFVFHSRANRKAIAEVDMVETNGRSGRTTSVTIGRMPGRQVIVYDKREEVMKRRKHDWPLIWNANLEAASLLQLDLSDRDASQIWRVELRLGKDGLRTRQDIRGWGSLHEHLEKKMDQLAQDVTVRVPSADRNRSRWPLHPLWLVAQNTVATRLFAHEARVSLETMREVDLHAKQQEMLKLLSALSVTLAYLHGKTGRDYAAFSQTLPALLQEYLDQHPRGIEQRLAKAAGRYGKLMGI